LSSGSNSLRRRTPPAAGLFLLVVVAVLAVGPLTVAVADSSGAPPQRPYGVAFQGNTALSDARLKKAAERELLAFGRNDYRRADIDDAAYQMEIAYREAGYAFATVDYRIQHDPQRVQVVFAVREGPRVILARTLITGNRAVDSQTLLQLFNVRDSGLLGRPPPVFVQSKIDAAVSRIRDFYFTSGFLDARVARPTVSFSDDRRAATVTVSISEGVRYVIRGVRISGDLNPSATPAVNDVRKELIDQPYVPRRRLLLQSRLTAIAGEAGYPFARISVIDRPGAAEGDIILEATVDSGPQVIVTDIQVRGNADTSAEFIRRRLRLKPGDRYSLTKERASFKALYQTGLFSEVRLSLEPREDPNAAELIVEVVETPSLEFYLEPGWGSYEKLRLIAGVRERSLRGTGVILNPEAKASIKAQSLTVRLTDPWFLHTDVTADLPAYYSHRQEPSFTRRDLGFSLFFSKYLTQSWKAGSGYNLRTTDLSDVATSIQSGVPDDNYNLGSIELQATYDNRNDLFFPTRGQRFFLSAEHADQLLGGDITFTRVTGGIRVFFPLPGDTVLGLRYKTGLLLPGTGEVTLPVSELFFNGGENTVRSFKESELGPKNVFGEPVGGYAYNVFNVEVRHRLIGNVIGTLFFDAGNVSPNRSSNEQPVFPYTSRSELMTDTLHDFFRDFRLGVGVGLQYLLPIGPLRADFAFNPDRDEQRGEDAFVFHFSVGAAF
jgi:outer membrane protein insertion porin family